MNMWNFLSKIATFRFKFGICTALQ